MKESCHASVCVTSRTWLRHVTYGCVISHTYLCLVTHMNDLSLTVGEWCHTYKNTKMCTVLEWVMSHITVLEWVMAHIWMSQVTHLHTFEWVMPDTWMSHVTHVNESCHTYEWISLTCEWACHTHKYMSHTQIHVTHTNTCHTHKYMSHAQIHVTHTNRQPDTRVSPLWHMHQSYHTCEWVTSYKWTSHSRDTNTSWHTYGWLVSHICVTRLTHKCVTCHTFVTHMTESCMT